MSAIAFQIPQALSVEVRKYRRTLAFWLALLSPLFLVTLNFMIYWLRETPMVGPEQNAWHQYGMMNLNPSVFLLFPMFVTLLAVFFFQIEHQNHSWKHLWILPIARSQQYLAKVLILLGLVATSLVLFFFLIWGTGGLLGILRPELGFQEDTGVGDIGKMVLWSGGASFALVAFQFWFSFRWRSILFPLALGFAGLVSANIIISWEYSFWHPYTAPMLALATAQGGAEELPINPILYSLAIGLGVFILAYFEGKRRVLKG
ncbi:MAG: ABC transporter permease [Bacteroidota bacterium]